MAEGKESVSDPKSERQGGFNRTLNLSSARVEEKEDGEEAAQQGSDVHNEDGVGNGMGRR